MDSKRVLIVDDDQTMLYMLEHSLKRLGAEYEITTVMDSTQALEQVQQKSFDLVVADFMMPKITGVDLATAIRKISPDTQVVLMTAYGTSRLRDTTKIVGIDGYLDKPFTVDEIHKVIRNTVQIAQQGEDFSAPADTLPPDEAIRGHLEVLLVNASARTVLLLNEAGDPIHVVGQATDSEVASIGMFVAKNFMAAAELANTLGSRSIFKSSYYEGSDFNLYAYDVNSQFLLAVVFESGHKPGVVWFYAKQTAAALTELLDQASSD